MDNPPAWKISLTSAEAWADMLASCRTARRSIDLEQYIFGSEGPIIAEWSALLQEKARAGVKVRLLFDAVGSFAFFRSGLRSEFEQCGIQVGFHKIILTPSLKRFIPMILRDHRKLLVVDGQEAYIGGVIIDERARHWRDTSVCLRGGVVADCQGAFEIAWEQARRMLPIGRVLSRTGHGDFFLAGNSFHLRDKDLYRLFLREITAAKQKIFITTPYFSLTRDLRRALFYARRKGVDVRILFPARSDNILADLLARRHYRTLLRRGVRLYHYTHSILHAKSICIDGRWASVGSCNFDWLSFRVNYELNVQSKERQFVAELERIFCRDIETASEVTLATPLLRGLFDY